MKGNLRIESKEFSGKILEGFIKKFGNSSHIIIKGQDSIGKKAKILIIDEESLLDEFED